MGIGGDTEEARLVDFNQEEEGVLGVDGGEMYVCRLRVLVVADLGR